MSSNLPASNDRPASSHLPASGDLPVIRLHTRGDLIAAVPYLVGYVPNHALVVLGVDEAESRVTVSVCGELPPRGTGATGCAEMARGLRLKLAHTALTAVYVLAYGDGPDATPLVDAVRAELGGHGVNVRDALRIHDGRYWSYLDTDPVRCPPDGIPVDTRYTDAAVQGIAAGCAPYPNRAAVADSIAPVQGERRAAMRAATGVAEELLNDARWAAPQRAGDDLRDASLRFLPYAAETYASGGVLDDVPAATLAIAVGDVRVRDRAICLAAHGDTSAYLSLWTDLARRVEPDYRVPVLVLLAFTAWRDGGGPLPSIAIDEALRADPGHSFAQVIRDVLAYGIPATDIDLPEPGELPGT